MKSLVSTAQAVQLTTHRPKRCLNPVFCDMVVASQESGLLFHYRYLDSFTILHLYMFTSLHPYRSACVKDISSADCQKLSAEVVEDKSIWRNKPEILKRVYGRLDRLGFVKKGR